MVISDIRTQENGWRICGFVEESERELLLWGEQRGVPCLLELGAYVEYVEYVTEGKSVIKEELIMAEECSGKEGCSFVLTLPVSLFSGLKIEDGFVMKLFGDVRKWGRIDVIAQEVQGSYQLEGSLYDFELRATERELAVFIRKKNMVFEVKEIWAEKDGCFLELEIPEEFFSRYQVDLCAGKRVEKSLWQFKDRRVCLKKGLKTGRVKIELQMSELLPETEEMDWWDFFVKLSKDNLSAEFSLRLEAFETNTLFFECVSGSYKAAVRKNPGKNLSITVQNIGTVKLCGYQLTESGLSLEFETGDIGNRRKPYIVFQRRQARKLQCRLYSGAYRRPLKCVKKRAVYFEEKADFLEGLVRGADEVWEVFLRMGGMSVPGKKRNGASGICIF